ncbi:MAG: hypothetical protein E7458_05720 [Ruminococcaceae bacterium]|nr:hypothetical protein [Oscillospiraceae bacterium]
MAERILLSLHTRLPLPETYPDGLARSIHFAVSDGGAATPLRANYGILFAEGTLDASNVIKPKGVKNPMISRLPDGGFAITAVRTCENGSKDEESRGQFLLWRSHDLCRFTAQRLIAVPGGEYLEAARLTESEDGRYTALWQDATGRWYTACAATLDELADAEAQAADAPVSGNTVELSRAEYDALLTYWSPLTHTANDVPETITAASADELAAIRVNAVYSDGSTHGKCVDWDLSGVDFAKPGAYPIRGRMTARSFRFPLVENFADPVLFRWEGKYYFIATNDGMNDVGLYAKEADTIEGLFREDCPFHLILPYDPARHLIQTFWAPEFHVIGGELYILFAVGGEKWAPQCHLMHLKKGGSIIDENSWEDPIRVLLPNGENLTDDGISLDMTYFEAGGTPYVCWSYRFAIGTPLDSGSMLYIAKADPARPWQLASEPVLISRPMYGWENVQGTINNEGPYALVTEDTVYLTYSGGDARGYKYVLGFLTADPTADLTDPAAWTKSPTAMLAFPDVPGQYGCGHHSYFRDTDGTLYMGYHAATGYTAKIAMSSFRRVQIDWEGRPRLDLSAERDLNPALAEIRTTLIVPEA